MRKFLVALCLLLMAVPAFSAKDVDLDSVQEGVKKGDPDAINTLGVVYYDGLNGVKKDYAKALKLFTQAADAGDATALTNIGRMSYFGRGVRKDIKKAAKYFAKAAEKGDTEGKYIIALMYDNGEGGYKQDKKKAAELYRQAAEEGYRDAQSNLAAMYYTGEGVNEDKEQAFLWFRRAAQQGEAKSQYNIAVMYSKGEGVEQNIDLAREWMRKAADQGYEDAINEMKNLDESK